MKIYIITDFEGASGVILKDQVFAGASMYEKSRHLLTQDVNAAVQGALDGGATDIIVLDGHGANQAYNLVYEELHEGARYIMGTPWPKYLPGFDESFSAIFQVGTHAMAATQGGILEHTMSSESWYEMRINGRPMGEMGLICAIAGHYSVPCALVTGDKAACDQAVELLGDVEVAPVKTGFSRSCAELLPPKKARDLICEKAATAARRIPEFKPFKLEGPVEVQIQYQKPVDVLNERLGVRRIDRHTVAYTGKDIVEAYSRLR